MEGLPKEVEVTETVRIPIPYSVEVYKERDKPERVIFYDKPKQLTIDSLVDLKISKGQLNISLLEDSTVKKELYSLDLTKWEYSYSQGTLTRNKIKNLRVSPYISGSYLPINKVGTLFGGITFETRSFNYKLGVGGYYYQHSIKPDLEVGITYKF